VEVNDLTVSPHEPEPMTNLAEAPPLQDPVEVSTLGPVLDFLRLIWAVDHGLQSVSKRMEAEFGITAPQRLVLRIVGVQPGIPAGRVAEVLHVHPSTLTGILQRLQGRGLILRKTDPRDARRALLHLTAKGKRLIDPGSGLLEAAVRRVLTRHPALLESSLTLLGALADELASAAGRET
jgi:DNA-binding MarR family transcriptional regulator